MHNKLAILGVLVAASFPFTAHVQSGQDRVVGAIWSYTITHEGKKETGQFRVFQHEIFKSSEKVGTVQPKDKDETTLHFTNYKEFKGSASLRKVKKNPNTWKGTLTREDGSRWEMVVIVKEK